MVCPPSQIGPQPTIITIADAIHIRYDADMTSPAEMGGQDRFSERLAYWQRALREGGQEIVERYGNMALAELDELCPDTTEECLFKGHAIWPIMDVEGEVQDIVVGKIEQAARGVHNGFQVRVLEEGKPELWYEFLIHSCLKEPNGVERSYHKVFAYIDPTDSVITPVKDFEEPFLSEQFDNAVGDENVHAVLSEASDKLAVALSSSEFRKLTLPQQREFVDNYVRRYETETDINHKAVAISAAHFYRVQKAEDNSTRAITRQEFADGEYIEGSCLSLGTLIDQQLGERRVKLVRDLVDKMAGLCLVLSMDDYQPVLGLCKGDIIYVPLSSQDVETFIRPRE
jgi:hypothetical protein